MMPPQDGTDFSHLSLLDQEIGPLCEAMLLMMEADGEVAQSEWEVLRGAVRNLSHDGVRTADIEAVLDLARDRLASQGREARIEAVAESLRADDARAEVAFVLASAIAFADNMIADQENDVLNDLADKLGIDEDRANALLDQLEADMRAGSAGGA